MTYIRTFCKLWPPFDIISLWIGLCKANCFYSHSNLRQVADKSKICNQLNMTGMILFQIILGLPFDIIYESKLRLSVITLFWYHISLNVFWKLNFSIHNLLKDKVQTCKTFVINGIWLAWFQLNRTQSFEIIHFASYDIHFLSILILFTP